MDVRMLIDTRVYVVQLLVLVVPRFIVEKEDIAQASNKGSYVWSVYEICTTGHRGNTMPRSNMTESIDGAYAGLPENTRHLSVHFRRYDV